VLRQDNFSVSLMSGISRDWAWGGVDGTGVRVCVLDSGIDAAHPLVGGVERSMTVLAEPAGKLGVGQVDPVDLAGHGTACAGIIRSIAPGSTLAGMRVLTDGKRGSGAALLKGLEWAIDEGYDVINMSLSTTNEQFRPALQELADKAYYRRTVLVCSAHNMPLRSLPWQFASVISVASHDQPDAMTYYYNATPPVEFYAKGLRVKVAWPGGGRIVSTGNSFATPHISGICALILSKHPHLTPFQLKAVLYQTANNVRPTEESASANECH
jgi:subtilisin family serine protease